MNTKLDEFLNKSFIAEKTELNTRIIIYRKNISTSDLLNLKNKDGFGVIPKKDQICELEIGGQCFASGKIIKKNKKYYFKLLKFFKQGEKL